MAYDVSQEILIMPDMGLFQFPFPFEPTLIIYADDCLEEVKNKAKSFDAILGAVSISDLSVSIVITTFTLVSSFAFFIPLENIALNVALSSPLKPLQLISAL